VNINSEKISSLIRECAAQYIMPRFKTLTQEHIFSKSGPNDLVTIADRETEQALERALTAMFPGCVVIGEEGIAAGHSSVGSLQSNEGMVWVADPVDGTYNFVHGHPEFAVMLACVIKGAVQYGWIYDVPGDRMLVAAKGAGAFLDGIRQKVAAPKPLSEARGFAGSKYFSKAQRPLIKAFAREVQTLHSLSCAGHEYLRLASGAYDFAIYSRGRPWDHLPGTLAVTEAGGCVVKWNGSPYTSQDDLVGIVVASGSELLETLKENIINKLNN
jgi:fructose-1,6-bisphosphatase/inositol monophosphatase family enzyme